MAHRDRRPSGHRGALLRAALLHRRHQTRHQGDHGRPQLKLCPYGCGANLRRQPLLRRDKRQVFDLPPQKLLVTEHLVEVKLCPNSGREVSAAFPAGVNAPTQYGPRFNAFLVYLRGQQLIPLERISQTCADLFGRLISEATVQAAVVTAYNALGARR